MANEAPLEVDANKVLTFAVAAVIEQSPEISHGNLAVQGSLDFQCWLTQPNETVLALDGEFGPCIAKLDLVLTTEKTGLKSVDRDGNCEIDPKFQGLHVALIPGDSISVGVHHRSDSGRDVVDCIASSGNQSSDAPPQSLVSDAWDYEQ
ncbi:MAG: hypothetical protein KJN78_14200 [Gammaproteobacteria bacterium]|nr:hypothetical protein [Gammaproteobacteria bacterium]